MTRVQAPMWVLVEGYSDVPTVREILTRHFKLTERDDFQIYPHQGKGALPQNPLSTPDIKHRGLLDQLPAKLRAFAKVWNGHEGAWVLVVVDVDKTPCTDILTDLRKMLQQLPEPRARVLFRLAIEETESWFIADVPALKKAFPKIKVKDLEKIKPDLVVGAAEKLAECFGVSSHQLTGQIKIEWAEKIAPHLNFDDPVSPSLKKLLSGIERELGMHK